MSRQPKYSLADYAEYKGITKKALTMKIAYYKVKLDDYVKQNEVRTKAFGMNIKTRAATSQRRLYTLPYLEKMLGGLIDKKEVG